MWNAISASLILPLIAPISQELVLCYVAERALGLPKSY